MLHQVAFPSGPLAVLSPLLRRASIPHIFSTRVGGVSTGPFASLNFGNPNGHPIQDRPANLEENYRRTMQAADLTGRQLARVHQVHGNVIAQLWDGDAPPSDTKADALLTDCPSFALSVRTADCVPILLASRDGRLVAAVHAGWRGIVAGILPNAINALRIRQVLLCDILIAIGPCIGPDAFEVGDEVVNEFRAKLPDAPDVIHRQVGRKAHIDMRKALVHQALQLDIPAPNIDSTDLCTYSDADLFFSHRREHGLTGRQAAFIGTRSA